MPFNMTGALEAGANFGTGFINGQQQAVDNQYKNNMQRISMQEATLDYQQKKLDADRMQQLSDYSMQKFDPTKARQGNPGQPNQPQQQGQGGNQNLQGQMSNLAGGQSPLDMVDYNTDMAKKAASIGDITRAEQFGTNAVNAANDRFAQQQKQATMQLTNMKARAAEMNNVSQAFQGVTDQASYDRVRMQLMSDPSLPADSRANIAKFPERYNQAFVDHVMQAGMTENQRIQAEIKKAEFQERVRMDNLKASNEDIRTNLAAKKEQAYEQHLTSQTKVGAANKVPTANDVAFATQATKAAMGPDVDENSDDFKAARQSIASRAQQLMRDNRALNAEQANNMAAQEAKSSGEFGTKTTTTPGFLGTGIGSKTTKAATFQSKGDTQEAPIEIKKGVTKDSDLVDGKYYTFNGKTYQAQGGKLKPIQ